MKYTDFLNSLSKPARQALFYARVNTFTELSNYTETEILTLHGIGKASLPTMRNALKIMNLEFKQ